tara:strand:+ start:1034 stop:2425 length:1392 start_codon:yes stop_codon:yes gene_type:complete
MERKKVCIQGLGFVGFAMSVAVANARDALNDLPLYNVVGIDLPNEEGNEKVTKINEGSFPISCNDESLKAAYQNCLENGNLKASTNNEEFNDADIVIVDINLDVLIKGEDSEVDFSNLEGAIKTVSERIKSDTLVIIETTVPPGTTENIIYPILKNSFTKRYGIEYKPIVAHSYERVMPGPNYLSSITNFWRVYAGIDKYSSKKCREFLTTIINTKDFEMNELSSTTASELSKVLENSYRAANIAFIQEWGLFSQSIGINIFEVIEAIKIRPTHSNIRKPGIGVGGYCLTKDPLMGFVSSNQIFNKSSTSFPITSKSVEINSLMPRNTFDMCVNSLNCISSSTRVLILGISYRDQVGDTRYSASIQLARMFLEKNIKINTHDPMVLSSVPKEIGFLNKLPHPSGYDAIIFTVSHLYYKELNLPAWLKDYKGIIIDSNNVLKAEDINNLTNMDLSIKVIGRGDL